MFIGKYEIDGKENAAIYYGSKGMELFNIETFTPESKNIDLLSFTIKGKTYREKLIEKFNKKNIITLNGEK